MINATNLNKNRRIWELCFTSTLHRLCFLRLFYQGSSQSCRPSCWFEMNYFVQFKLLTSKLLRGIARKIKLCVRFSESSSVSNTVVRKKNESIINYIIFLLLNKRQLFTVMMCKYSGFSERDKTIRWHAFHLGPVIEIERGLFFVPCKIVCEQEENSRLCSQQLLTFTLSWRRYTQIITFWDQLCTLHDPSRQWSILLRKVSGRS